MIEDEVEAVARAIARARRSTSPENPEQDLGVVSEQHRELARLTIATLELHRASKGKSADRLGLEELEQTPADCPDTD
ncbi:hypothetical protein DC522_16455 [Microvirga sp. KLBC 81]|uniref:hypothetical protein n=1 Tax=Microvirga sp. KLBC 81 TaxID=1862707 RepID=UPI000D51D4D1|nr:hypothetical protein [Microvirga sp. KLBC 81]PVE23327.1 hypothetical protein DC522_16455 [Microvirga sp. KLBC 81]